jgi:hypothetical protein
MKYPIIINNEKLIRRNQNINQLLFFLPDRPIDKRINISHANTRNGNPRSIAISDNLVKRSAEIYGRGML